MKDCRASSARPRVGDRRALIVAGIATAFIMGCVAWQPAGAADGPVVTTPSALAAGVGPDFDGVAFLPLVCGVAGDPQGDESPAAVDLVGDASHAPTYFARDASYLYFRLRVSGNPTGAKGFAQYSWVILLQVPSGDPFQHQFEIALNGGGDDDDFGNTGGQRGDTVEVWKNDPAENIVFDPLFHDSSEVRLFAQRYDYAGPLTANTTPLARIALAADGSAFGGDPDYFLDFAVPLSVLIAKGVVTSAAQLAEALYFPATSAESSQYNKDHLDCPFLPYTNLTITKGVVPSHAPAGVMTGVVHTITLRNDGGATAKGLVLDDTAFPSPLSAITVHVSSDDPTVSWAVVTSNPLQLRVPRLPQGRSITVRIESNAAFTCSTPAFTNTAKAWATNAEPVTASATLGVATGAAELCDGKDNDCDGQIDEGGALCSDGNACTTDSCSPISGCTHTNNNLLCDDGFICTADDRCSGGICRAGQPLTPDCEEPRPTGFYQGICTGPRPADELTMAYVACVNDWSTFASVTSTADVCRILESDRSNDRCLQAESQLMAALLNLCKSRLRLDQPIASTCTDHLTAGPSIVDANTRLSNPSRSDGSCVIAQCESAELNSGKAIGSTSLQVSRISGVLRLSWAQPPTGPGWATPTSYFVWRRPRATGLFEIIGTASGLYYDDHDAIPGSDVEYELSVDWP